MSFLSSKSVAWSNCRQIPWSLLSRGGSWSPPPAKPQHTPDPPYHFVQDILVLNRHQFFSAQGTPPLRTFVPRSLLSIISNLHCRRGGLCWLWLHLEGRERAWTVSRGVGEINMAPVEKGAKPGNENEPDCLSRMTNLVSDEALPALL